MRRPGHAFAAAAVAASLAAPSLALESWPTPPHGAQSGEFAATQFTSDRREDVVAEWRKTTPGVNLPVADKIRPGREITNFIIFRGCKADAQGVCHVEAVQQLIEPSGRVSATTPLQVWPGRPARPPHLLQMSEQNTTFTFLPDDPTGTYLVRTVVRDKVAGISLKLETMLEVLAN